MTELSPEQQREKELLEAIELPCDVKLGGATFKEGTSLYEYVHHTRNLAYYVARMSQSGKQAISLKRMAKKNGRRK